ncbi:MAG: hypothetical protein ABI346_06900 [Candidatus Baltobacteraceae bacterium]
MRRFAISSTRTHGRATRVPGARMLKRRLDNILTYLKHHVTTDQRHQRVDQRSHSVGKTDRPWLSKQSNLTTAISFHSGGLDLTPKSTGRLEEQLKRV